MVFDRTQRPIVPDSHPDEREHRRLLAVRASASMPKDGTERMVAPLKMQQYVAAALPDATLWEGSIVHQSDDAAPAFSDGVDWTTLATKDSVTTVASDLAALTALTTPVAWIIVPKTSNEARNNAGTGATLTDDAVLKFAVAANTKYRFRLHFGYTTNVTADFKYQYTGPAGVTALSIHEHVILSDGTNQFFVTNAFSLPSSLTSAAATFGAVVMTGLLQNGANAGNVTLQWAQNTANAGNTTVLAGSFFEYQTV